jgi:polysaccharide biosynthesis protein PslH
LRILYVVPNVPSPIRSRPFNFIRSLSRHHEVSVLCLATEESDYRFISDLRQFCSNLEVIALPRWRSLWNCLTGVFSSKSLRHAYFYSPQLRRRVIEKVAEKEIDLLHAEHLKSVPMVEAVIGKIPTVFDAVDCVSMFEARRKNVVRNPFLKFFFWTERNKMAKWEAKAIKAFNRLTISSTIDKESYPGPRDLRTKLDVIPNGVDLDFFAFRQFPPRKNVIVFCAKLDYFGNADAALYFARSIWPTLLARRPDLQLEIVGNRPPRAVQQLHGRKNIRVIGSVPDVRPLLGSASIALSPLRVRAGIQFKILEAMAMGVPVIATSICCPGLGVQAGKELLVADTPEQFADAVELLLLNERVKNNLIAAGRQYVEAHHDWEHCVKQLSDTYSLACESFGTPASRASRELQRSVSV